MNRLIIFSLGPTFFSKNIFNNLNRFSYLPDDITRPWADNEDDFED